LAESDVKPGVGSSLRPCENITTDRGRDDAVQVIQGFRAIGRQVAGRVESLVHTVTVSSADATVTGAKASGGSDAAATGTATSTATGSDQLIPVDGI
jgi:hypothetical protein